MKYLTILDYIEGRTICTPDPKGDEESFDYIDYILLTYNLKPNNFHYMIGVKLEISI